MKVLYQRGTKRKLKVELDEKLHIKSLKFKK